MNSEKNRYFDSVRLCDIQFLISNIAVLMSTVLMTCMFRIYLYYDIDIFCIGILHKNTKFEFDMKKY